MVEWIWTFRRADERIAVVRCDMGEGSTLSLITTNDPPRQCYFADLPKLLQFQADMEAFLLRTGWSLMEFSPERRRDGRDRRGFPRIDDDRRRWWTDGVEHAHADGI